MPAYDTQTIGNSLGWGIVNDAPNAFVWEIGHTSPFTSPAAQFCVPGQTFCESYNAPAWADTCPSRSCRSPSVNGEIGKNGPSSATSAGRPR